jgi:ubiquinone/menaquinone biosynthesis C-methylase UbiE
MPTVETKSRSTMIAAIVRQFGHPQGTAGRLVGWVMAHRASNRKRNVWVVSLLDVQPTDRVLEIGFGPGVAIAELTRRVGPAGHVYGIDRSDVMVGQASRRNAAAVRAGTVTLTVGAVEQLPAALDGPFDAILAVNSLGFWTAPVQRLEDLRRRLTPGGPSRSPRNPCSKPRVRPDENRDPRSRAGHRVHSCCERARDNGTTAIA